MTIHQLGHNKTVIKSKYENDGYWLLDYLEFAIGADHFVLKPTDR